MESKQSVYTRIALVACGSFNPPTYMHLRLFEMARDHFESLDVQSKVAYGFLSPVSDAYRKPGLLSWQHRVKMCELAAKTSSWISVHEWEAQQPEYVRTVFVLDKIQAELFQKDPDVHVYLLCGADLVESFAKPGVWSEEDMRRIFSTYQVACVERVDTNLKDVIFGHDILFQYRHRIHIIPQWISNDVSSTKVRASLRRGLSVNYLLPRDVIEYIQKHGLYAI